MDLYDEFGAIIDALTAAGVEYAVCGGIAVAFHGHPRFTKDIDLLVPREELTAVKAALAPRGYTLDAGRIPFEPGTPRAREIHRVSRIEGADVFTLDLLVVPEPLSDVWESREVFEWQGRRVSLVSLEGLVRMKRWAGRPVDRADLAGLGLIDEVDDE